MPKVTLSEEQAYINRIKNNLKYIKAKLGATNTDIAKIMGTSDSTARNRFKHPDGLRTSEALKLCKYARIDINTFWCDDLFNN